MIDGRLIRAMWDISNRGNKGRTARKMLITERYCEVMGPTRFLRIGHGYEIDSPPLVVTADRHTVGGYLNLVFLLEYLESGVPSARRRGDYMAPLADGQWPEFPPDAPPNGLTVTTVAAKDLAWLSKIVSLSPVGVTMLAAGPYMLSASFCIGQQLVAAGCINRFHIDTGGI